MQGLNCDSHMQTSMDVPLGKAAIPLLERTQKAKGIRPRYHCTANGWALGGLPTTLSAEYKKCCMIAYHAKTHTGHRWCNIPPFSLFHEDTEHWNWAPLHLTELYKYKYLMAKRFCIKEASLESSPPRALFGLCDLFTPLADSEHAAMLSLWITALAELAQWV